jgi:hypothetical protein
MTKEELTKRTKEAKKLKAIFISSRKTAKYRNNR